MDVYFSNNLELYVLFSLLYYLLAMNYKGKFNRPLLFFLYTFICTHIVYIYFFFCFFLYT